MAVTSVRVGKSGSRSTPIKLIVGDSNSQVVRIIVPRHFGGVDLGALAWAVEVRNANGATDIYYIFDKQTDPECIELFWKLTGTATSAVGVTEFQVQGLEDDTGAGPVIWQSGVYCMQILPDEIEHVPGNEEQQALTALQGLIVYVNGELNTVLAARDAANTAAGNADSAATEARLAADAATDAKTGAEAAATDANNAAASASAEASNAKKAASDANTAMLRAAASASSADSAAQKANNAANNANSAANTANAEAQGLANLKGDINMAISNANTAAERANANADAVTEVIAQTEAAKQTAIDAAGNADDAAATARNAAQAADAATEKANAAAETATEAAKDAPIMITMSADCASIDGEITITDVSMPPSEIQKTFGSGKHIRAALTITVNDSWFNKYIGYVDLCQGYMVLGSNPKNLLQWTGTVNDANNGVSAYKAYRVAVDLNNVDSPIGGTITAFRIANDADVEGAKTRLTNAETNIKGIDARVTKIEEEGVGGAVKSVNGKTGAVVLDAEDVGALPKDGKAPNPYALTIRAVEHPTFAGTPAVQTIYHGGSPTQVELPSTGYVDEAARWANIGDRPFGWFGRDRSICNWGWVAGDENITVIDPDALVSICPVYDVVRLFNGYPYTVTLNGNVYECTGTAAQIEGTDGVMVDVVYIGNPVNFAGEDNGMPFTFIDKCGSETLPEYFKGDAFMILTGVDTATTKVLLDIYEGKFLVKIPGEYIDFATDEEILAMMLEMDALPTLVDADGDVLIGADNTILLI